MEKIELSKVIHKELLMVGSKATTKAAIITELAKMLGEQNFISSAEHFITDVYLREEEGETGIGQGVAIPRTMHHRDSRKSNRQSIFSL